MTTGEVVCMSQTKDHLVIKQAPVTTRDECQTQFVFHHTDWDQPSASTLISVWG